MQKRRNSGALALELRLFRIEPYKYIDIGKQCFDKDVSYPFYSFH